MLTNKMIDSTMSGPDDRENLHRMTTPNVISEGQAEGRENKPCKTQLLTDVPFLQIVKSSSEQGFLMFSSRL